MANKLLIPYPFCIIFFENIEKQKFADNAITMLVNGCIFLPSQSQNKKTVWD